MLVLNSAKIPLVPAYWAGLLATEKRTSKAGSHCFKVSRIIRLFIQIFPTDIWARIWHTKRRETNAISLPKKRLQFLKCLRAVADFIFHVVAEFGKRLLVGVWNEQRVVAKSIFSARR